MNALKLIFLAGCFITCHLFAQSHDAAEKDLTKSFDKVKYWGQHQYDPALDNRLEDSLQNANKTFGEKLKTYAANFPFTIIQKFSLLKKMGVDMTTSPDRRLSIYSWDTYTGGTWRNYCSVFQYKRGNKTYTELSNDWITEGGHGVDYPLIFKIKIKNKTYYLVEGLINIGSCELEAFVSVWKINNKGVIRDIKLFKTGQEVENSIEYEFECGDNLPDTPIFNKTNNTISIPLTTKENRLTGRYITYKFTGKYFE